VQDDLKSLCNGIGQVRQFKRILKSKCAFVAFSNGAEAQKAFDTLNGYRLGSMCLQVNTEKVSRHLWVGSVASTVREEELFSLFQQVIYIYKINGAFF